MAITDLKELRKAKEAKAAKDELRNRPKANWFSLKNGEQKKVQFLNELTKEAENYKPEYGTFYAPVVHNAHGPEGFKAKALDTMESEGKDYAQEMYEANRKETGWKPKTDFYINVATAGDDGKIEAQILQRNLYSSFVDDLADIYDDSDGVGITGKTFIIKRTGEGPQTVYGIRASKDEIDIGDVVPWDLEEYAVRKVPYAEQKEFYGRYYQPERGFEDEEDEGNSSPDSTSAKEELDW